MDKGQIREKIDRILGESVSDETLVRALNEAFGHRFVLVGGSEKELWVVQALTVGEDEGYALFDPRDNKDGFIEDWELVTTGKATFEPVDFEYMTDELAI
jgi:hypothetical protein